MGCVNLLTYGTGETLGMRSSQEVRATEMLPISALAAAAWSSPLPLAGRAARARVPPILSSLTETIMSRLPPEEQMGGAGGATTYEALLRLDDAWAKLRAGTLPPPRDVVFDEPDAPPETPEYDLVVAGGNIGILLATALVLKGLRVAVLEAGPLRGRNQDWNASRKEVMELVEAGVLSLEEVPEVIGIEFNPVRCGFQGGEDVWLNDVLNVGVRPDRLVALARARFEAAGGVVLEKTPLSRVTIRPGAAVLSTGEGGPVLRTRLLVDCMGQRSPIVAQVRMHAFHGGRTGVRARACSSIARGAALRSQARGGHVHAFTALLCRVAQVRGGAPPDGVCVVVGSCADGYDADMNTFGDVIFADTVTEPSERRLPDAALVRGVPL